MLRFALCLACASYVAGSVCADVADEVLALTGARTKIVWAHCVAGRPKSWDAISAEYELKGFDTQDRKERVILPGPASYFNPCISPDGELVLYTDNVTNTIHAVNFDGSGRRELGKGCVLCTWRHPFDRSQWVYFTTGGTFKGPVARCRIDAPTVREIVWEKAQAAVTLTVSADGTRAGSEFPHPYAGVAVLPDVSWKQYGNGCNGCIAPDNSYRFFHMGEEIRHNGIIMYDDGGTNRRVMDFTESLPADAWAPRWTNDVRFLTINSPIGFPDADIYLGKFDGTFSKVEKWVKVTSAPSQDTKACGWIDPGLGQYDGEVPCTVEIPAVLTPGGDWEFDWGDGLTEKASAGKHTFRKPGSWTMTARKGDTVLKGWMNARPQKPPAVREVRVLDETHLKVLFDERIQLENATATLTSGVPIKQVAPDAESQGLLIALGGPLGKHDTLRMDGIFDRAQTPNRLTATVVPIDRPAWPANRSNLVFLWEADKKQSFFYSSGRETFDKPELRRHGLARYDRNGAMNLDGGCFVAADGGSGIVSECAKNNAFTLEVLLTPANLFQGRSGMARRIVGCSGAGRPFSEPNFALCQEGDGLWLLLRSKGVQRIELCKVQEGRPSHLVVSCGQGSLQCYLDGELAKETEVAAPLAWVKPKFDGGMYLGGRQDVRNQWHGRLECVAVFAHALEANDVASDYAACSKVVAARRNPQRITIKARLAARSEMPTPADVAPYRDALIVNEYEVMQVLDGKCEPGKMCVAQWGLLDGRPTELERAKVGDEVQLTVESFSDHPELETEAIRNSLADDLALDLFIDVKGRASGAPRPAAIEVLPGELWMPSNDTQQFSAVVRDQYGNPMTAAIKWSATPGGQINTSVAHGAGQWYVERNQKGEGSITEAGLFTSDGKPGVVTISASSAEDPSVKGATIVCVGDWPGVNPASPAAMRFGLLNSNDGPYVGDIDRIRIYGRALAADEVAKHAAGQMLERKDGLVGDWTFDELKDGVYPNMAGEGLAARPVDEVKHVVDRDGRYVHMDGTGFLEVAHDPRLDFTVCTIEAWIRPKQGCLVSKQMVWMWGFKLAVQDGGLQLDGLRTDSGELRGSVVFPSDAWTHVVGVLDVCGRWQLYADGKLLGEKPLGKLRLMTAEASGVIALYGDSPSDR
jgi:hypothetical protein